MAKFLGKFFKLNKKNDKVIKTFTEDYKCETYGSFENSESNEEKPYSRRLDENSEVTDSKPVEEDLEELMIAQALNELEDELEEIQVENSSRSAKNTNQQSIRAYKPSRIKPFLNQDVNEIRKRNTPFVDPQFPPSLRLITENISSELGTELCKGFQVQNRFNPNELNSKILWKKCQVFDLSELADKMKLQNTVLKFYH